MGWIIFAVIAVIVAILLVIPIALHIRYDGETTRIYLRILCFKFLVSDTSKLEKNKKSKRKTKVKTKAKKEKAKDRKDLFEILKLVCDVAHSGLKAGKVIAKSLHFYGVRIHWKIARDDPYETGLAFGNANAALYPVLGTLANLFKVKFERIDVYPDFTATKDSCDITLKAKITPFNLIKAAMAFALDMIRRILRRSADNNRTNKEGALING